MSDFKAKMHQIRFRLELRPDPAGGAYSAPPDLLAGFKGPTSKVREGTEGEKMEGNGEGGKGEGGERRGWEGTPPSRIGKVKRWQPYLYDKCSGS